MEPVSIGLIGLGTMGVRYLEMSTELQNARITAIAGTRQPGRLQDLSARFNVQSFASPEALIGSRVCEAVLIAAPHPAHARLTELAAEHGVHVLVEKPIAVTVAEADRMTEACRKAGVQLGVMFQQRTISVYQNAKALLAAGAIGDLYRCSLVATDWFRTQAYYGCSPWRGSWRGEGGGIVMNQAPHVLDLLEWFCGHPVGVTSRVMTRWHDIEVEDTAEALLTYANGATGSIYISTAESPGQTRFELFGARGKLEIVDGVLRMFKLDEALPDVIRTGEEWGGCSGRWEMPSKETQGQRYATVIDQFARAVRESAPLLATAEDGVNALELANAILLSAHLQRSVSLPLDRAAYDAFLAGQQKN